MTSTRRTRRAVGGMTRLRALPAALVVGLALGPALALPVHAETGKHPDGGNSLGSVIDETTTTVLRLFQTFMKAIPQFEAPEVLPNGDIIIRRKPPGAVPDDEHEDDKPEEGETRRI